MELKLVIAATFTARPIEDSLHYWLEQFEIPHELEFAPYSQVFQQLLDPASALAKNADGANLVLVRIEDWAQRQTDSFASQLEENVNDFLAALAYAQQRGAVPIWLCLCPPSNATQQNADQRGVVQRLEGLIAQRVKTVPSVELLQGSDIAARYSVAQVNDPGADAAGHVPYTPEYFAALGTALVRSLLELTPLPERVGTPVAHETSLPGATGPEERERTAAFNTRAALHEPVFKTAFEEVFCSILEISPAELTDQTSQVNLASWTSLAHLNLIAALEETYDVSFSTQEILALKSVGGARALLTAKGVTL